jgi:hypothetical protein
MVEAPLKYFVTQSSESSGHAQARDRCEETRKEEVTSSNPVGCASEPLKWFRKTDAAWGARKREMAWLPRGYHATPNG